MVFKEDVTYLFLQFFIVRVVTSTIRVTWLRLGAPGRVSTFHVQLNLILRFLLSLFSQVVDLVLLLFSSPKFPILSHWIIIVALVTRSPFDPISSLSTSLPGLIFFFLLSLQLLRSFTETSHSIDVNGKPLPLKGWWWSPGAGTGV